MRPIPPLLQAKLDSGVTTLARAWKLTRRDGVVMGFTDHDRDLIVDGVTFRAGTGFTSSEAASRFGLSVDGAEISGALADDSLTDADLAAGRYDAAEVETWLVDWSDPPLNVLTARAKLGEVRREGQAFVAELRGLADLLSQESGRLYTAKCGADLGDLRCRVDLTDPAFGGSGRDHGDRRHLDLCRFRPRWLCRHAVFRRKADLDQRREYGLSMEVKQHRIKAGQAQLSLWQAMPEPIAVGDTFAVTAGCDKTLRHLPRPICQHRQFPRLSANPRQRFPARLAGAGRAGQ